MLFSSYKKYWQLLLNIVACFVIAITLLFVGLLISYAFFLPISGTPDLTFFQYVDTCFSPDWGVSTSYMVGMPITELIGSRLFRMLEFLWVPILLGLIGGIALGRKSFKLRRKWRNKVIQLSIAIGIAFPIIFLGMMLQYNSFLGGETHSSLMLFFGRFPVVGFKSPWFPDPIEITGFPILDARLSGQMYLAIDRIEHLILPIFTLTPVIIAFVAWQTRSNMERKQNEKSILSHTMKTVMLFGFIMTFYFLIETTFNLHGMLEAFIVGISHNDPNVVRGVIFVILIFLVILTFISSIIYSVVRFLKFDKQDTIEKITPSIQSKESNPSENNPRNSSIRSKAVIIALVAGVLSLIGFLTPYVWISVMGMDVMIWSSGLISVMGIIAFDKTIISSGVLILISALLLLATGALGRKRGDLKAMGYIWILAAIIGLIGLIIPIRMMVITTGLSIGFFLPLIGSIIGIIAGATVFFMTGSRDHLKNFNSSIRSKAGLIALTAGVLCFIGFLTPYVWLSIMGITAMSWSWGLVSVMGVVVFVADFAAAGILILIGAILLIVTGYLSKKREDLKIMAIIWVVSAILVLVGVLILSGMGMSAGLSIGFYLPLFGSIIGIIAGALVLFKFPFYKYPLVLLGLIVTIGFIVCAFFAELISGYTLTEANGIFIGSWEPPSGVHTLGTTKFGRDVFARVLYGLRGVLTFGINAVFIGLAGGIIFGFISSLHRYVNRAIEVILIIIFIIPVIIVIPLFISIFGFGHLIVIPALFGFPIDLVTVIFGILLIPLFTRGIANVPLEKRNISKSLKNIVIYIPLAFGIFVLIYESLAFLGYDAPFVISLGNDLSLARLHLYDAPWTVIWPGLFIFFTAFGSITLHYGLKNALVEKLDLSVISENYREIESQID